MIRKSEAMEAAVQEQKKIIKGVLLFGIMVSLIGVFVVNDPMPFVTGIVFGTLMAILNFRLLYLTLKKAAQMAPAQAQVFATSRYFSRYLITGAVLYVSIRRDHINVLGTILGLISIKLVILTYELFSDKKYFKRIFKRKEVK